MARKSWVKVKRGLINDPKHREAMGEAIWLYLHILDRTNYEDGIVYDWKDAAEAETLRLEVSTLRRHRRRLEGKGYINTVQHQHSQLITVNNWTDPTSSIVQSVQQRTPSRQGVHSSKPLAQSEQIDTPSDVQGVHQGIHQGEHPCTPVSIINSHVINQEETTRRDAPVEVPLKAVKKRAPRDPRLDHPGLKVVFELMGKYPSKLVWDELIGLLDVDFDEPRLRECAAAWAKVTTNMGNLKWVFEWYRDGIPKQNRPNGRASPVEKVDRIRKSHDVFLERHGVSEDEDERRFDSIQQNDFSARSYL